MLNVEKTTPWTLDQLLAATGGRLAGGSDGERSFVAIGTDSRTIGPGELFVALAGERYDGRAFIRDAVARGAAGVLVAETAATAEGLAGLPAGIPVVAVADTLTGLGDLAAFRRRLFADLPVLAVTGSSGKTTVKEMVAAILELRHIVLKTRGNFNNLVGLPLSLLPLDRHHQVALLEMGMNRPGEIARLAAIAAPDISCIVNVQAAHLEGLGSIEGVALAKNELFAGTRENGTLVVNLDDPLVRDLARRHRHKKITCGLNEEADVRAGDLVGLGRRGTAFTLHIGPESHEIILAAPGRHNVTNALAAGAMAHALGADPVDIARGLAAFTPCDKRSRLETLANGLMVINDCYNANPASMRAALTMLADLGRTGKKIAVLGDMLELGEGSAAAHRAIGETAARLGLDYLAAFGPQGAETVRAAREQGLDPARARSFADKEELTAWLADLIGRQGLAGEDWLLVKGSRGMRMESVLDTLRTIAFSFSTGNRT